MSSSFQTHRVAYPLNAQEAKKWLQPFFKDKLLKEVIYLFIHFLSPLT